MSSKQLLASSLSLTLPNGRLAPHSLFFLFFNLVYFLPLLGVALFNYSEGGTSTAADLDFDVTRKITFVYLLGILAFVCGSKLSPFLGFASTRPILQRALRLFGLNSPFRLLCWAMVGLFVVSKVLLVGLGVYSQYAFETDSMTGGVWSFSMFCSESLLFLSIVVLFSNARRNVLWFLILTGINGINLLHGTRIFFIIAGITFCFYLYLRVRLTLKIAILAFSGSLLVSYLIFLSRSKVEVDVQTFSFTRVISPIMYEGIFSQLSLIETIKHPQLWSLWGSLHNFFLDALYFVIPRFLLPGKDEILFINRFSDLSPLGAFSGYAQGLIYFGVFFPLFYCILGIIAGWLLRQAKDSQFWSAIYVYFVCDFMFRIMRDGYIIPIKMLVNGLTILAFVVCCSYAQILPKFAPPSRQGLKASPQPSSNGG